MADEGSSVKTLVGKIVLDISDVSTQVSTVKAAIGSIAEQSKSAVAEDKAATEQALASGFKQIEQQKQLGIAKQSIIKETAAATEAAVAGAEKEKSAKTSASEAAIAGIQREISAEKTLSVAKQNISKEVIASAEAEKAAKASVYSTEFAWLERMIASGKAYTAILSEQLVKSGIIRQGAEASGTGLSVAGIARVAKGHSYSDSGSTTVSASGLVAEAAAQKAALDVATAAATKLHLSISETDAQITKVKAAIIALTEEMHGVATEEQALVARGLAGTLKQLEQQKALAVAKQLTTKDDVARAEASSAVASAAAAKVDAAYAAEHTWITKLIAATKAYGAAKLEVLIKQREETAEVRKEAKEEEGLSAISIARGFTKAGVAGASGGGIIGSTLTGLIGGVGLTLGIEAAYEAFEKLTEKMKEFIEDSGGLQKVTEQFERLSKGKGEDPTEFLEQLRSKTRNLVPDVDLLRAANTFLQSSLKLSVEDMIKLTEATVGLARAQGHDAADAIKALNQSFLSGRSQQLAQITGIQSQLLQVRGMGETLSRTAQTNISFAQTVKLIEERYADIGQPLLTYTDRLQQLKIVQQNLFEGVAQGVVTSSGFTVFMQMLGRMIENLGGMEGAAKRFGEVIGNTFGALTPLGVQLSLLFKDIAKSVDGVGDSLKSLHGDFSIKNILGFGGAKAVEGAEEGAAGDEHNLAHDLKAQFEEIHPIISLMIKLFAALGAAIREVNLDLKYLYDVGGQALNKQVTGIQDIIGSVSGKNLYSPDLKQGIRGVGKFISGMYGGQVQAGNGPSPLTQEYEKNRAQIKKDEQDSITLAETSLQTAKTGERDKIPLPLPTPKDPALARRQRLADAQAEMQELIANAKAGQEAVKDATSEEAAYNEAVYKKGNESIDEYYAHKDSMAKASKDAAITAAIQELAAKNQLLDIQVREDSKFASAAAKQKEANAKQANEAIDKANTEFYNTTTKNSQARAEDISAANIEIINSELQAKKTALAAQADATKAAFDQGTISAGEYLETRIGQITQETNYEIDASQKRAKEEINNRKEVAAEYAKQIASAEQALKQLQDLQDNALPQVFQKTNEQFSNALGSNQSLQQINAAGGASLTGQSNEQLQDQQAALLQGQITNMSQLLQQAEPLSNTWYQIYENILKATTQLQQLNNEMQDQRSLSTQVGGVFSAIGQQSKSLFTGTFGRGFASSFAGGAGVLSGATKTQQELQADLTLPKLDKTGKPIAPVDPVIAAAKEAADKLASSTDTGSRALQAFTSALQTAVAKLNSIISDLNTKIGGTSGQQYNSADVSAGGPADLSGVGSLDQSGYGGLNLPAYKPPTVSLGGSDASSSPGGGGGATDIFSALKTSIGHVISGDSGSFGQLSKVMTTAVQAVGSFAQVIAGATSPLGGALGGGQAGAGLGQSIAGSFGPAGAIIGALGGAALGAIVGQKQQNIQHDIVSIQYAVIAMNEAFSAGTASLGTTIGTLQGIIATLEQEKASSKKGSSQFQDLINQYNQQLAQLQAQQTQVIQQMTQQLASVSSPVAYQQWIQNIDQVIQQYAQFAGAAQNATQLAQANEYLTSSLQNIGTQIGDQLIQEEESAIQNALQLNQLYNQRNQLELQYLNQVQQIMSQGNLTRQRTQAQSAFSQLYDVQVNYQQQLDSINQQINLAQYQLSVQQQIFNLATTKAGLESQLLTLQEQGVNEDMQRIAAMQTLLKTLQGTGYSITNLGALSANDPNALANQLLQDLVNELGTGQSTMIQQLTQLINVLSQGGGFGAVAAPATPNVVPSNNPNAVTDLFTAAYQARASFGYGAYRGQNL